MRYSEGSSTNEIGFVPNVRSSEKKVRFVILKARLSEYGKGFVNLNVC